MNSVFRYYGIIVLLFTCITSCKKSSEKPVRDLDKLRLSRIVYSDISSSNKNVVVSNFEYDDQQRVDKIDKIYTSGNYGDPIIYSYNGSDKNPYKSHRTLFFGEVDIYYTYNNSGALIQDSAQSASTSDLYKIINKYSYSPGSIKVEKSTYETIAGVIAENKIIDSFRVENNNLTEAMYFPASPFGTGQLYHYTYDDKINPVSRLNIASINMVEGFVGYRNHTAPGISKNNIIEYSSGTHSAWSSPRLLETQKLSYTYTREGLPETCIIKTRTNTYTYEYIYEEF